MNKAWTELSTELQEHWIAKAQYLLEKNYPTPTNNLYKLAEMLYNSGNIQKQTK